MAENVYRFEFVDGTQSNEQNGIVDILGSGNSEDSGRTKSKSKSFSDAFTQRAENIVVQQTLISPLNTMTGGLASPIYRATKSIMKGAAIGASLGTLGATLGIMALQRGIDFIQNRMKELETKVESLNNTDNALIRAGSVSKATYYSANIFGIKQTTNRS